MNRQRGCRRLSTLIAHPSGLRAKPELIDYTTTWHKTRDGPALIHSPCTQVVPEQGPPRSRPPGRGRRPGYGSNWCAAGFPHRRTELPPAYQRAHP